MTAETALQKRDTLQRKQSLQRRAPTGIIHASYYQQLQKVRLTKRDKRYCVYIFYVISSALLLLSYTFTTWRYSRIAAARAALGQQYLQPANNLFLAFLIVSLAIGLYAFLASFYRQVSVEYFISTCIIILASAPVFLAIEVYGTHQFQVERQTIDTRFFMQVLKTEVENNLTEGNLKDFLPVRVRELALSFGQIRMVSITSKTRIWSACTRYKCVNFRDTTFRDMEKTEMQFSPEYKLAESACRAAKYRELLVDKAGKGIGQICVTLQ